MRTEEEIRKKLEEIQSGQELRNEGFHQITDKGGWWEEVLEWVLEIELKEED